MHQKKGYERWQQAATSLAVALIESDPILKDESALKDLNRAFLAEMFGEGGKAQIRGMVETPLAVLQNTLFRGFTEIDGCRQAMRNIEIYIARFPYDEQQVRRSAYLRYHFENFLHEVYMLQQRIDMHLTVIARAYRRDSRHDEIVNLFDALRKRTEKSLKGIIDTRGSHVHRNRFDHPEFNRLSLVEFFEKHPISDDIGPLWRGFYLQVYRELRSRWRTRIRENNQSVADLLDDVGETIVSAIFTGAEGAFAPPEKIANRTSRNRPI